MADSKATERRGRRIALDVAAGMAYLHSKRIVHLDLKTPNVSLYRLLNLSMIQ